MDNDFWKDTSRLVLIVHGMNGNSKGGIRGIEYDFPGTKTIYLEYEKVCYKKSLLWEIYGAHVVIKNFLGSIW